MKSLLIFTLLTTSQLIAFSQDEYYDNGKYKASYEETGENTVLAVFYYRSGNVMEKGSFKNNLKEGEWVSYTRSGKINAVGFYTAGKKSGIWKFYDLEGLLSQEVDYTAEEPEVTVYNQ